jgi:hypothetical protein
MNDALLGAIIGGVLSITGGFLATLYAESRKSSGEQDVRANKLLDMVGYLHAFLNKRERRDNVFGDSDWVFDINVQIRNIAVCLTHRKYRKLVTHVLSANLADPEQVQDVLAETREVINAEAARLIRNQWKALETQKKENGEGDE